MYGEDGKMLDEYLHKCVLHVRFDFDLYTIFANLLISLQKDDSFVNVKEESHIKEDEGREGRDGSHKLEKYLPDLLTREKDTHKRCENHLGDSNFDHEAYTWLAQFFFLGQQSRIL